MNRATITRLVRSSVTAVDPPAATRDRRPDLNADRRFVHCTACGRKKLNDWAYTADGSIICPRCYFSLPAAADPPPAAVPASQ